MIWIPPRTSEWDKRKVCTCSPLVYVMQVTLHCKVLRTPLLLHNFLFTWSWMHDVCILIQSTCDHECHLHYGIWFWCSSGAYAGGGGVWGVQTPPFGDNFFFFFFLLVTPEVDGRYTCTPSHSIDVDGARENKCRSPPPPPPPPAHQLFGTCATFDVGDWRKPPPYKSCVR